MWVSLCFLLAVFALSSADTPANCMYEDIKGTWTFYETDRVGDNSLKCEGNTDPTPNKVRITLQRFDTAVDEFGNTGTWTMIYNQGFEITVNQRTYFAFSKYEQVGEDVSSYCGETLYGSSHDVTSRNWACFRGYRDEGSTMKVHKKEEETTPSRLYKSSPDFINRINAAQKSWTAKKYEMFEGKTYEQILNMRGGRGSKLHTRPRPAEVKPETQRLMKTSPPPQHFDWRDINGVSYVPDVRDQASCGSCYIFASMATLEARIRIATNNTKKPVLSPQQTLSCSPYSQGCNGGFPYLIAGRYAQDFGLVEEECMPYEARDMKCKETKCARHYVASYDYVGGYYGACNEAEIMRALVESGPIAVNFEVYDDFSSYAGGIYHYTGLKDEFNPFEIVNHSVVVVGYGTEPETGEAYWIVLNSWGEDWGENGYFRIRRGVDECGIESLASVFTPIP